jgi:hypothetical protein
MFTKYKLLIQIGGALALVAALVGLGYWVGSSWTGAEWEAKYEKREGQYKEAGRLAEQQARSEETRRAAAVEGIRREARERIAAAESDAADERADADGMRKELANRTIRATHGAGACPGGSPTTTTLILYSELLDRADDRASELAAEADRRRIAGLACEEQYNSLNSSPKQNASL